MAEPRSKSTLLILANIGVILTAALLVVVIAQTADLFSPPAEQPTSTAPIRLTSVSSAGTNGVATYVSQAGQTLSDLANELNVNLEDLLALNPHLTPQETLEAGTVIMIPISDDTPSPSPTSSWPASGRVASIQASVNLRTGPGAAFDIACQLNASTPIQVTGRTIESDWYEVISQEGLSGWAPGYSLELFVNQEAVPIVQFATETYQPSPTPEPTSTPLPPATYPYLSNLDPSILDIFRRGQELGNRANVFSKIGDSITVSAAFLFSIGNGEYDLAEFDYLQPVIDHFSQETALTGNSFSNISMSAQVGWSALTPTRRGAGDEIYCSEIETPLECEYRLVRPSMALIMLGTNDIPGTPIASFEIGLRAVIEQSIEMGVIPIVSTLPPMNQPGMNSRVIQFNEIIRELAIEYRIPLWDYWAPLQGLPDSGMGDDGVHPSVAPRGHWADFSEPYLQYGMVIRNLTALQALNAVWNYISSSQ
jgi:lysophospholipase L1-like esterase